MKTVICISAFVVAGLVIATAAPGGRVTYPVDKLEEATARAKADQLPLLFVSGESSTGVGKSAARAFRNEAVIVLLEAGDFKAKGLTPRLLGAFVADAKQINSPHLVFSTFDQSKVLAILPGKMLENDQEVGTLKKSLGDIISGSRPGAVVPDVNWCWQSKDPKVSGWIGAFSQLGPGDILVLKKADGRRFQVPLAELVPHHVEFAKTQAAPVPYVSKIAEEYVEPGVETWTNSEGKEIRATFVSGESNILTLKLPNGAEVKVPFEKLSKDSKSRAVVLAIRKALRPK